MTLLDNEQTKSLPSTHGELIGTHWKRKLTAITVMDVELGQAACLDTTGHTHLIPISHLKAAWQRMECAHLEHAQQ